MSTITEMPYVRAGAVMAMVLVLATCGRADQENTAVPRDFAVTLQRTVCFGPCPGYTVSVDASGLVRYDGTRCVAVYGHQKSRLPQARLRALMADSRTSNKDTFCPFARNPNGEAAGSGLVRRLYETRNGDLTVAVAIKCRISPCAGVGFQRCAV